MPDRPRPTFKQALSELFREALSRSGSLTTVLSVVVGAIVGIALGLAGLGPAGDVETNLTILAGIGLGVGFVVDVLFLLPIKRWRDLEFRLQSMDDRVAAAERRAQEADAQWRSERNHSNRLQEQINGYLLAQRIQVGTAAEPITEGLPSVHQTTDNLTPPSIEPPAMNIDQSFTTDEGSDSAGSG